MNAAKDRVVASRNDDIEVLTIDEAATFLRCSRSSIKRLIREDRIRPFYLGPRAPRFRKQQLLDDLAGAN